MSKWFQRQELMLFLILCLAGTISSIIAVPLLNGFKYEFGKNLIGFFVPPFLTLVYVTIVSFKWHLNKTFLIKAMVLYLIQIIPFSPLLTQVFQPSFGDDFARYYLYAQNMVDNKTLWGGDKLFFRDEGDYYVTQPGFRYFIAAELLVFQKLYRFVPLINIALLLMVLYAFQKLIQGVICEKWLRICLLILVVLFTPFAVKNLLMGLPEWLAGLILIMACYLYIVPKSEIGAIFLLGLVPFFRQNLLITVFLVAFVILFYSRRRVKLLVCFLIPLFLPLYHNLYYAGEWRFFVRVFEVPFLKSSVKSGLAAINYDLIINNIVHYLGIDIQNGHVALEFIAVIFLPFSSVLYFILLSRFPSLRWKLIFLGITLSAIVPAILFGTAYYPRFEFVNVLVVLVTFLLLYSRISARSSNDKWNWSL